MPKSVHRAGEKLPPVAPPKRRSIARARRRFERLLAAEPHWRLNGDVVVGRAYELVGGRTPVSVSRRTEKAKQKLRALEADLGRSVTKGV